MHLSNWYSCVVVNRDCIGVTLMCNPAERGVSAREMERGALRWCCGGEQRQEWWRSERRNRQMQMILSSRKALCVWASSPSPHLVPVCPAQEPALSEFSYSIHSTIAAGGRRERSQWKSYNIIMYTANYI